MPEELKLKEFNRLILLLIGFISIAVFVIDIFIPLGASGGVAYLLFVMATFWTQGRKITVVAGVLATLLLIAGFMFSVTSEYILLSAANHIMMVIAAWSSVWFVNHYKSSINQLRENYQTLFKVATDEILVYQLDEKGRPQSFLEANDTACKILGYSRAELLNMTIYDVAVEGTKSIEKKVKEVIEKGYSIYEGRHRTKDGVAIPLEFSVRSFTYNGLQTIISSGRDLRERRALEREILNISENERQRIGQDLHDDLGQILTVAKISVQDLLNDAQSKDVGMAEKTQEISELIAKATESTRTLSHGLVPVNVETKNLEEALRELSVNTSKMQHIDVQYVSNQENLKVDNDYAVQLYRIAQEAINNAVKHGNASKIQVELTSAENEIILRIIDDGSGFQRKEPVSNGIGLRIMKFRSQLMNGTLRVKSQEGEGTEVICKVPLY